MNQESQTKAFTDRLYKTENTDELQQLLVDVNAHAQNDAEFRPRRIRMAIYGALRDNLGADVAAVRESMLELWQLCTTADKNEELQTSTIEEIEGRKVNTPSRSQEDTWERHEARELLGEWIAAWIEVEDASLRQELCDLSCELALRSDASVESVQAACWMLGAIDWRSEEVENTLWQVLAREDIAGDVASGVLADMGLPTHQRAKFIYQLRVRSAQRSNRFNAFALQRLGEPELLDDALAFFEANPNINWSDGEPRKTEDSESLDELMRVGFLSQLADSLWQYPDAQNKIWDTVYQHCNATKKGRSRLLFTGDLARRCDSPSLIGDFFNALPAVLHDEIEKGTNPSKQLSDSDIDPNHFILSIAAERLKDSNRPQQLKGWQNLSGKQLEPFSKLALRNTHQSGMFATSPMRAKEICWQMLAMAGGRWDSAMVERALRDESSGSSRKDVGDVVACFGCSPLPLLVVETLTQKGDGAQGERDISLGEDSSLFVSCRGIENIARGTADRAAFEALLGFNYVYGDDVLRSTNDALNEVAAHLIRSGDSDISSDLWKALSPSKPTHQRILAISGLHFLALEGLLPTDGWERFFDFAEDQSIDPYFRALALQAIGFFNEQGIKETVSARLREAWIGFRGGEDAELSWSARESLARHGTWRELTPHEQTIFLQELGLEEKDGNWRVKSGSEQEWENSEPEIMRALGGVYRSAPSQFEAAVCDVLNGTNENAAYALSTELFQRKAGEQVRLDTPLIDAIISQIKDAARMGAQSHRSSVRRYVFEDLSFGAPQRLLEEPWREITESLPSDARAALADAIGHTEVTQSNLMEASLTLEALAQDGSFVVRRAALRAASVLIPEVLEQWCKNWGSKNFSTSQRESRLKAFSGLPTPPEDLTSRLYNDREPSVRKAAHDSANANRQRRWADSYLASIRKALDISQTPEMLYAYGVALAQTGDDSHLHALQTQDIQFPNPAMRFWWKQTVTELQDNWRKATRDWSDLGEGSISSYDDKAVVMCGEESQEVEVWYGCGPEPE